MLMLLIILALAFNPNISQAKEGDEQDQIILLNDSASALEDSDPALSKSLTQFADEKEKEWENSNANKDTAPSPVTDKDIPLLKERIKLLSATALEIQTTYPLIAKGLDQMVKDMNKEIEVKK